MASKLIRTPQFNEALRLMSEGGPFTFITGRAGTGKSTLLNYFRETTDLSAPILAPTGVAALNVNGETIHRFFRFAPGITVKEAKKKGGTAKEREVYAKADLLVIDEISMVRADLMDCIDQFLRAVRKNKSPFGGLRIVAIGDLYQLPPVVTASERLAFSQLYDSPYFFGSQVVRELLAAGSVSFIELETVYRQSDSAFIGLLNAVRNRSATEDVLTRLNARTCANVPEDAIILTAMNAAADELNEKRLNGLPGKPVTFHGTFNGDFPEREAPTDPELRLKKGARIICVANDPSGRFVNGSLGWVKKIDGSFETSDDEEGPTVTVELDDGGTVAVSGHTWTIYRSVYDRATRSLDQERVGSFTQMPLRLAWAVTIHKSQGKTFDRVTVDLGRGAFAAGQTYVALSRCRSFEGLALVKPVRLQDIRLDYSIVKFVTSLQYALSKKAMPLEEKLDLLRAAADKGSRLEIVYLKGKDEKSTRIIVPRVLEEDEYAGRPFLALRAWCELRQEERTFNAERILEIRLV
jgi:ATP-dependent DNA helicase PIF1